VLLGFQSGDVHADWLGILLIGGACAAWAIDNNLTQSLTVRDPRSIVRVKAGVAGTVNVLLAFLLGQSLPTVSVDSHAVRRISDVALPEFFRRSR
jgi:hypothetical protein